MLAESGWLWHRALLNRRVEYLPTMHTHTHTEGVCCRGLKSKVVILIIIAVIIACSHISQPFPLLSNKCGFFFLPNCVACIKSAQSLCQQAELKKFHKERKKYPLAVETHVDCCRKCHQKRFKGSCDFYSAENSAKLKGLYVCVQTCFTILWGLAAHCCCCDILADFHRGKK